MSELLVKVLVGALAGLFAFRWGMLAENIKPTWLRVTSFCLLVVYATGIGVYLFFVH